MTKKHLGDILVEIPPFRKSIGAEAERRIRDKPSGASVAPESLSDEEPLSPEE